MDRRKFMLAAGGALLAPARWLHAEHHMVSADPLIVESDLWPLRGRYTRLEDFYVRNHFQIPEPVPAGSLTIEGEVEKPGRFTLESFSGIAAREVGAVLECAGSPLGATSLVSDGLWRGWPLGDILAQTTPRPGGTYLHLFGRDGFSRSVPLERALKDGLLATSLNGRPLGPNHGAPWRALFPGWYGMDSVKWLEKIVVASAPLPAVDKTYLEITRQANGELEGRPLPRILVKSVITVPADKAVLPRGAVGVQGLAWSGGGKIASVQVSADGGSSWRMATLDSPGENYDWTLWRISFPLEQPGVVNLVSKATDDSGGVQPETRDPRRADLYGYNVWHRIRCVVL